MNTPMKISQLFPASHVKQNHLQNVKNKHNDEVQGTSFKAMLEDRMVHFSNHAVKRLEQRGIELKPEQLNQIESAIDNAAAKGAKDSLILMKDMALIVNVNNRTIVTAMDGNSMKDNVFTKIDSAVIIS